MADARPDADPPAAARPAAAVPTDPDAGAAEAERGLTAAEVEQHRARGWVNVTSDPNRRTVLDIVRANVLTRFNAILGAMLAVVVAIGAYRDALFGFVLVSNALIGIVQELRAKRTLDRLGIVAAPKVTVVRDGAAIDVDAADVVLDDVVEVRTGDQIVVDGAVLAATGFEVDESLLSGEADPVHRGLGDPVRSGSFVVAGRARFHATAVGDDAYAARLAAEARRFDLVRSELREGTDLILRVATWFIVPTAVLLMVTQLRHSESVFDALRGAVAGIVAIIPEGLVLLTSMAFALGVIRLAQRRALVQELPAVEVLARVDVVCVDKTGTLTEGGLRPGGLELVAADVDEAQVRGGIAGLVAAEEKPNPTLAAAGGLGADTGWPLVTSVPFSSARKWSAASFGDGVGTWVMGAPDVLLAGDDPLRDRVEELAATGNRVLLVAHADDPLDGTALPAGLHPRALVRLEEQVRGEAAPTVAYFHEQGVQVKVISGDHPVTVGAVATAVGVPGGDDPVDARELPEDLDALADVLDTHTVFGRVQPHQKRAMVRALQSRGHTVAMTGDGVNDVLALKEADMGVAMGSGSGASRSVAQLVLLDDSFATLPQVVAEGRRVIANVERVASLFVTKSVYAFLLAVAVGIAGLPFPFFPRHLTIISSLTIGIPGFFLALEPNDARSAPGFVARVARFAIPAGLLAAVATFTGYALAHTQPGIPAREERTAAVIVLFLVGLWVLRILASPLSGHRIVLVAAMAGAFVIALLTPGIREFFDLQVPRPLVLSGTLVVAGVAIVALEAGWRLAERWRLPFLERPSVH